MIPYRNYSTFLILDAKVNIISDDESDYPNTVAEINGRYHYLGAEQIALGAAILGWQALNGRELTDEELKQVIEDNPISSKGIPT
jgi:hypothetical protein